MRKLLTSLGIAALVSLASFSPAQAAGEAVELKSVNWKHGGLFGTYDRASAQRGLQVYREVCAGCHGLGLVAFRTLKDLGFSEEEVKALAAESEYVDGPDDAGDMFDRPGKPSDKFPSPFPNEQAARASNGGAYPPDLSLMTKARPDGDNYMYSLLTGYEEAPSDVTLPVGMYYNAYFPGHKIAMPPPLLEDGVEYSDGTPATVDQMAKDVSVFLAWAAEPKMEQRKSIGLRVILFLLILAAVFYAVKRKVWSDLH
ncbi:cytochrome c1 [uncultured Sneathiella sp.]|jgi:ubiquinol-cytochrome c reductase cytochrome c1 subunit|uniref:cytochrome c1 n=1 Tax=uncultured Sneathiella sp. TaxID=879315 RepID=UPI0030DB3A13|tara:strand:+ start:1432 stop:2199 length:768 start_codon:yes stop_codon:yes gene_type:complete